MMLSRETPKSPAAALASSQLRAGTPRPVRLQFSSFLQTRLPLLLLSLSSSPSASLPCQLSACLLHPPVRTAKLMTCSPFAGATLPRCVSRRLW